MRHTNLRTFVSALALTFVAFSTNPASAESPFGLGFGLPDSNFDVVSLVSALSRGERVSCHELLAFLPPSWIEPFGDLRLEGVIAPRLEILRSANSEHVEFRLHGIDTESHHCRVAKLKWESKDVDWLNTPFTHSVSSDYLPPGVKIQVGPGAKDFVPIAELPPHVGAAMVYSEEHGFYENQGINADLIARAMSRNRNEGRIVTGGSTITQQLVKNLFLSREKTLERKFQEAILATRVWQKVSKERVLELYLNCIEFGPGVWGIGPASQHYFGKDAPELTVAEASFLAAIKPQPMMGERVRRGKLDLKESGLGATVGAIIRTMHRHGVIDDTTLDVALAEQPFPRSR